MRKFQSRKSLLRCPKSARPRCLAPASGIEAPGRLSSWRPPRRRCSATTPQPRRGRRAPPSAAAFGLRRLFPGKPSGPLWASGGTTGRRGRGAVGGRRKWWECGALYSFNRQRNDECFGLHILKTVHLHKHIGQASIHLFYNITFDEKICNLSL